VRRLLLGACALRFADSFVLIAPFYTLMFAERGLTPAQIGIVLAAWSLVGLTLEVPCGVLADRVSRRWLLSAAQLVRCVGFLAWLAFPGFWGFLVGLMLWGLKSATLSGAFEAVVYDELKLLGRESDYVRVFGRTQAARFAGVLSASLGAAGLSTLGYPTLIWASIVAGLTAAGAALLLPAAPRALAAGRWGYLAHLKRGAAEAASLPGVPGLLLFIAGMQAVVSACADYWQLFAHGVGLAKPAIGLFIATLSAAGVIAATVAHRLRGLRPLTLSVLLAAAGGCVVLASAIYRPWSVVLLVAYVALYWLVDTNADARFQHRLRPETRATVASFKGFATQSGTSLLMLGFGAIAQFSAYRWSFLTYGAVLVALGTGFALASALRGRDAWSRPTTGT
jgi:MFS family permease